MIHIEKRILIVADDLAICHSIRDYMKNDDTDICCAVSAAEAFDSFINEEYCLTIWEIGLLNEQIIETLSMMRKVRPAPIMVIIPKLNTLDKVSLFRAGANACIEKPINIVVCAAQANSLIQLYIEAVTNNIVHRPLIFGSELIIDQIYRQVIIDGEQLELTRTEFDLLFCLAKNPGRVWSREQLYRYVWNDDLGLSGDKTVRTHIGNLRRKLADMQKNYVQTSRGIGYKFVPPATMLRTAKS